MLENLCVSNFRSHEKSEIALHSGLNIFLGEVGAGKTSILEALSFSLFGKISTSMTQTELIKRGSKQAKVILVFSVGSEKYKVERTIFIKKTQRAKLWLYKNNNWRLAVEGSNAVSKSIEEILGVDSSTFLAAIYASQGEIKKMLQTQPGKRREQFDKLLGIDVYEKLWDTMGQSKGLVLRELLEAQKNASGFDILTKQEKEIIKETKEKTRELDLLQNSIAIIKKDLTPKEKQLKYLEEAKIKIGTNQTKLEESLKRTKKAEERIKSLKDQILKTSKAEKIYKNNSKYLEREEELRKEKERIEKAIQKKCSTKRLLESEKSFLEEKNQKRIELQKQLEKLPNLQKELKNLRKLKSIYSDLKMQKKERQIKLDQANEEYIKNWQKSEQEIEKIERINELGECPTCLQEVPEKHKRHIKEETVLNQLDLKKLIIKWGKSRELIQNEIKILDNQIENSEEAGKKFERVFVEIEVLEKNKVELGKIKIDISTIYDRIYSLNWELSGIIETDNHLNKIEIELKEVSEKAKVAREAQLKIASKHDLEKFVITEEANLKKLKKEYINFQKKLQEILKEYNVKNHTELREEVEKYKDREARTSEGINRLSISLKREKVKVEEIKNSIIEKREAKEKTIIFESELKVLDVVRKGLRDILQPAVRKNSVIMVSEEFQQFYQALSNDNIDYAAIDEDGNIEVIRNGESSPINTLSGGETTCAALALRLSICSSLTKNQLLLLDEPTIHLDEVYRAKLRDFLRTHNFDQLIVVTHDNTFDSLPAQIFNVEKKKGDSIITPLRNGGTPD
jgi:exonuclease SbcC